MKSGSRSSREAAETLAIQALGFIAEDPKRLDSFLALSGISSDQIREAAQQSDFLAGVLDHMLGDERLLVAFADSAGIDPAAVARLREALGRPWEPDVP
jgi:hypothetical protein